MLNRENFAICLEILIKCLPTPKIEDRIDGLYYFFKKSELRTLQLAVDEMARELEKFPTPAIFGRYLIKHQAQAKKKIYECELCEGIGIISAKQISDNTDFAFRCHCQNASVYQKIPAWNEECKIHFKISKRITNVYQDLHDHYECYEKGANWLNSMNVKTPKDISANIINRIEKAKQHRQQISEMPF